MEVVPLDLKSYFDRVVVISLERRKDRLDAFVERVATCNWPFRSVDVFKAVDGKMCPPAPWFEVDAAPGAFEGPLPADAAFAEEGGLFFSKREGIS